MKFGNSPSEWRHLLPRPGADSHKHMRGRLGVVSGGALSTGAARLSARAGLRVGAGLVKVFCPPDAAPVLAPSLEAVMLASFATPEQLQALADPMDAIVIGPAAGLIESTALNLAALARTGAALVVDADALTLFRDRPEQLFAWLDRDDVLTPHEGEFERLFPGLLEAQGREGAAQEAARLAGAIVVLKGAATVIAAPDGRLAVNGDGSPWLATAGTGDVLAGLIGGLIAQHMDSFDAARAAVWMHSEAARRFGPGLISEDLPQQLPAVLADLLNG
ncbi:NAD(P)H-hydrate dehydratase [Brevundimonas sp. S1H14]|uniref:NAD(P)H-hydrate dehydratase n=1 Tax=Brevundimonas TaxID=41275 RepID=UPI000E675F10|nr:NAD(P)H-hydrate dehydratase [Brevundimonas sp. LPMIX5]RIJ68275.1 NAD(P)H-hydrate dehydratase [Brevundimonas sp. LPMIX5]